MRHKHYDVIIALAEGRSIQYKLKESNWMDWTDPLFPSLQEHIDYRVKPEIVVFRNYLWEEYGNYCVLTADQGEAECIQNSPYFVRWVGEWQSVEV